ncbi:hypothetical protein THRCLA_02700 [Thraustotheca clavata]|uniref:Uncharacterized protein n=1 Tax=Thraustotheca clavata TaxID=74557 RepID=A0A1W0A4E9_9STRA|nr:hypothetical protein THRCLA_02700 [Thraustotheca clavata]
MTSKRVVVLCGWMDGQLRLVNKYKSIYEQLGYESIVLLSLKSDFLKDEKLVHSLALPSLLEDTKTNVQFIPHMFSNGGCRSWYCFENHLQSNQVPYKVPAMIFDSAPYTPTFDAIEFTWHGAKFMQTWRDCIDMRFFLIKLGLYPYLTQTTNAFTLMWQRYFKAQANVPKLFLYSSKDTIISSENVEAAIQEAKSHGTIVEHINFEKSQHVAHFPYNPQLYTRTIHDFLDKHANQS